MGLRCPATTFVPPAVPVPHPCCGATLGKPPGALVMARREQRGRGAEALGHHCERMVAQCERQGGWSAGCMAVAGPGQSHACQGALKVFLPTLHAVR